MAFEDQGGTGKSALIRAEVDAAFAERERGLEEQGVDTAPSEAEAEVARFEALTHDERAQELSLGVAALRKAIGGTPWDPAEYARRRADERDAQQTTQVEPELPAGVGTELSAIDALLKEAASLQTRAMQTLQSI